jgi:hypothetical protein
MLRIGASMFQARVDTSRPHTSELTRSRQEAHVASPGQAPVQVAAVKLTPDRESMASAGNHHGVRQVRPLRFAWAIAATATMLAIAALSFWFLSARALTVRQVIQPSAGGRVSLSDGARVVVPPEALTAPATLTLTRVEHPTALVAENPFTTDAPIYDVGLLGKGTIQKQVFLMLPRPSGEVDAGAYYWDSESWIYAGGTVAGDFIECSTRHLSLWTTGPTLGNVSVQGYSTQTHGFHFPNDAANMEQSAVWQEEPLAAEGICAGMGAASVVLFEQSRAAPSASRFSDLSTPWQEYLIREHVANTRMDPWSVVAWSLAKTLAAGMSTEVAKLREGLADGHPVLLRLYVNDPQGSYGHGVVAYDWRKVDTLRWTVTCYDPNTATEPAELSIVGRDDMSGRVTFSVTYRGNETYFVPQLHPTFDSPLPD